MCIRDSITGDRDMVATLYPDGPIAAMKPFATDLRVCETLNGCGHWTQQERPKQVNDLVLRWLSAL